MFNGPEIWIIILLVVVLFGGKRLPNIARNLGKAQSELKKGLAEGAAEAKKDETPKTDSKLFAYSIATIFTFVPSTSLSRPRRSFAA